MLAQPWDFVIVTASQERQACAYRTQLSVRRDLGLLADINELLVVPDPGGRRVGSGGSTLVCLGEIARRRCGTAALRIEEVQAALEGLRILVIHAGGDSRRLPAYGPCGKILVPVPGESDRPIPMTLFDRQLPTYLRLPEPADGARPGGGQIVVTSGDVLLSFDPAEARFAGDGLTALACPAPPEQAIHHGVFCRGAGDEVRRFLQKPSPAVQEASGAVDAYGQTLLDIGVMSFDAALAGRLFALFGLQLDREGGVLPAGEIGQAVLRDGLDLYGEVCCGLGTDVTWEQYVASARSAGSRWSEGLLRAVFDGLRGVPFHVRVLPRCEFLHFGTTRQIISSGYAVLHHDLGVSAVNAPLNIGNDVGAGGQLVGAGAWVEGCRVQARLELGGDNVVTGVDVSAPLALPRGACVDVTAGQDRQEQRLWFLRCYGADDTFKDTVAQGATFCGRPILEWLKAAGAGPADVWDPGSDASGQTLWTARLFPAIESPDAFHRWLWMFDPARAESGALHRWKSATRYSMAEVAELTDLEAFFGRRADIGSRNLLAALRRMFRPASEMSAAELAYAMRHAPDRPAWLAAVLQEAHWYYHAGDARASGVGALVFPRVIHTIGTAVAALDDERGHTIGQRWAELTSRLERREQDWLDALGLDLHPDRDIGEWAERARAAAFEAVSRAIISSGQESASSPPAGRAADRPAAGRRTGPANALRADEIVWGRAPVRLDLAGGWSDTPPYSLEHGGSVTNVAVNLNGLPPIQAYARVTSDLVVRISSIDLGARIEIRELDDLLDYRHAESEFALVKAALVLSGFSPQAGGRPEASLADMLAGFGGGIEVTTMAAIPKGSGLGTSSIMGAVILAVLRRMMGQTLSPRELFHGVLRLEQALTTGGGWQDQIGGGTGGVKIISAAPGLVPDARVHYLPADVLDPRLNGGRTLLYYTGITRLARNILSGVVGRYLNRDRQAMATLRRIRDLAPRVAEAVSAKDLPLTGLYIDQAWRLNKRLDPDSSNPEVEALLSRVAPRLHGAKLLGAGGGGFLLMVCKSAADALRIREDLLASPPNSRARFFDFQINDEGLVVTVC